MAKLKPRSSKIKSFNKKGKTPKKAKDFRNKRVTNYSHSEQKTYEQKNVDVGHSSEGLLVPHNASSDSETETNPLLQLRETFSSIKSVSMRAVDSSESDFDDTSCVESASKVEQTSDNDDLSTSENSDEEELLPDESMAQEDSFVQRVTYDLHPNLVKALTENPIPYESTAVEWPTLGHLYVEWPKYMHNSLTFPKLNVSEATTFAPYPQAPKQLPMSYFSGEENSPNNSSHLRCNIMESISAFQRELFSIFNNYQDLMFCGLTLNNMEEIRYAYCMHAANHVIKTRSRVLHHNAKISAAKARDAQLEEYRDQGLVRPKVLIVLPLKSSALKTVLMLSQLLLKSEKGKVMNKKRFLTEFGGNDIIMPMKNRKPQDFEQLFAGNSGDDFRIGLTLTKQSLKLYTDFYSSDIIIASPLGLRTILGAPNEMQRDFDFLASIELLILDQCEIFLMQNWDHVVHLFDHLHLQPKDMHGTDLSRVRTWCLNGHAKYYRQTIFISGIARPEFNAIFNRKCSNYAGRIRIRNNEKGCMGQVLVQVPQIFRKFSAPGVQASVNQRFKFFVDHILPLHREPAMRCTLIYIPIYFDYVHVRNFFKREDISFVQICEYSKDAKVARARDLFFHGDVQFMLYTERFHFYNRIRVKGIRHLIFYQPPTFAHFYTEMCNYMQDCNMNNKIGSANNMSVTVLFSNYDIHQLSAIMGTERATHAQASERDVQLIVKEL